MRISLEGPGAYRPPSASKSSAILVNLAMSSLDSFSSAAPMFSSTRSGFEVPGIGIVCCQLKTQPSLT